MASQLRREREERGQRDKPAFERVLALCLNQIKCINRAGGGKCVYRVPRFLPGFPLYDPVTCGHYVVSALTGHGFTQSEFLDPDTVVVEW